MMFVFRIISGSFLLFICQCTFALLNALTKLLLYTDVSRVLYEKYILYHRLHSSHIHISSFSIRTRMHFSIIRCTLNNNTVRLIIPNYEKQINGRPKEKYMQIGKQIMTIRPRFLFNVRLMCSRERVFTF